MAVCLWDLGNEQSVLENWGDFVLGELATPDTAMLAGNLFLGDTGTWYSAMDFADNTADRIVVSGAAYVSGTIHFGLLNANKILPGVRSISLVEASKTTDPALPLPEQAPSGHLASTAFGTGLGEVDLIFPDSLIMTHNISEDAGLFAFGYDLDFAADWMTTSRQVVGEHFNSIQLNGSSDELAGVIVNLLFTDQEEVINLTYDLITPEVYSRQISQQIQEASYFADRLSRCDRYSVSVAQDDSADCFWMGVGKTDFDLDFGSDWVGDGLRRGRIQSRRAMADCRKRMAGSCCQQDSWLRRRGIYWGYEQWQDAPSRRDGQNIGCGQCDVGWCANSGCEYTGLSAQLAVRAGKCGSIRS